MGSQAQPESSDPAASPVSGVIGRMADDDLASIGYEAAYPFLQAPQWREAMLAQPDTYAP